MWSFFWHELKLVSLKRQDIILPLGFYLLTILIFPLGLTPDVAFIQKAGPGIITVSLLFANLLSLDRLFAQDYASGLLDVYRRHPSGSAGFMMLKVAAHWIALTLPILMLSPVIAVILEMDFNTVMAMISAMLVGTPFLSLVGALGAALTLSVKQGALMLIVIILPLFIAPLIFISSAMNAAMVGFDYTGELALLAAMSLVALIVCPFLLVWILRILD